MHWLDPQPISQTSVKRALQTIADSTTRLASWSFRRGSPSRNFNTAMDGSASAALPTPLLADSDLFLSYHAVLIESAARIDVNGLLASALLARTMVCWGRSIYNPG